MKIFFAPLVLMMLLATCLTGCLQEDNIKVDGDMTTVFSTGSGFSHAQSRARTGISF